MILVSIPRRVLRGFRGELLGTVEAQDAQEALEVGRKFQYPGGC